MKNEYRKTSIRSWVPDTRRVPVRSRGSGPFVRIEAGSRIHAGSLFLEAGSIKFQIWSDTQYLTYFTIYATYNVRSNQFPVRRKRSTAESVRSPDVRRRRCWLTSWSVGDSSAGHVESLCSPELHFPLLATDDHDLQLSPPFCRHRG